MARRVSNMSQTRGLTQRVRDALWLYRSHLEVERGITIFSEFGLGVAFHPVDSFEPYICERSRSEINSLNGFLKIVSIYLLIIRGSLDGEKVHNQ